MQNEAVMAHSLVPIIGPVQTLPATCLRSSSVPGKPEPGQRRALRRHVVRCGLRIRRRIHVVRDHVVFLERFPDEPVVERPVFASAYSTTSFQVPSLLSIERWGAKTWVAWESPAPKQPRTLAGWQPIGNDPKPWHRARLKRNGKSGNTALAEDRQSLRSIPMRLSSASSSLICSATAVL